MKARFPNMTIRPTGKLAFLATALAVLLNLTGCVQSVFPWHADEDVVFDANLAGAWIGDGDMEGCSLNIIADAARQVRHYNIEITRMTPQNCEDLGESRKWSAGGELLQIRQQRFVEVWDDKCGLYTLLKLNGDSQTMSLVPMDSDVLAQFIDAKREKLQGRVDGHSIQPDDVLLTSPTEDLRRFLRNHANDEKVFPAGETVRFHRR